MNPQEDNSMEEEIDFGNLMNFFAHLQLAPPEDGQGRYDCVWCTVSALTGISLGDLQSKLTTEERPLTKRGIEWDGEVFGGATDHQVESLLAALDQNILCASRINFENGATTRVLDRYRTQWDRNAMAISLEMAQAFAKEAGVTKIGVAYSEGGPLGHCVVYQYRQGGWEFIDWQRDPVNGKVFTPASNARIYLLFAINQTGLISPDQIWYINGVDNKKLLHETYAYRNKEWIRRREEIRKGIINEIRKKKGAFN